MLDQAWRLSESVALRPEPFGALAYHFGNRRLSFLKVPTLVTVVQELGRCATVQGALEAADVPEESWPAYLRGLSQLAEGDMIVRQEASA